jgi:integrase
VSAELDAWRANKRRWDHGALMSLPVGARVFEGGVGVKRTSDGLSWFVYYRAPVAPGARKTKTIHEYLVNCANKTQAAAALIARKAAVNAGTYRRQERSQEITLEQLSDLADKARRHLKSVDSTRHHFDKHILPWFGRHTIVRAITRELVERFYAEKLDAGYEVATANNFVISLKAIFKLAAERRFLDEDPTRGVRLKRRVNRRERMLTAAEAAALVSAAHARTDYLRPLFVMLLGTGMRLGEALRLEWNDVDLEHGFLRIRITKTDEPRWVVLAANVRAELERWKATIPGERYVFPGRRRRDGTHTHISQVKHGWASLCAAAGVKVSRHELRHNFVSQALAAGYSAADIMTVTGHRSMQAFEMYAHSQAERKRALVEAIAPPIARQRLPGDCQSTDATDEPSAAASK